MSSLQELIKSYSEQSGKGAEDKRFSRYWLLKPRGSAYNRMIRMHYGNCWFLHAHKKAMNNDPT